ncbi:MAG TPA: hypothetical protein VMV24_01800 [Candidatus Dormibacteraeota bacterium]|nr:hypothetical protein [Candidatus Dormibacteraeota bacterium]
MDNINQLLKNKLFNEPPEIKLIKDFIRINFDEECLVKVSKFKIAIIVPNSALAGALREKMETLKGILATPKDISISIGRI